jgi:hypothetical protein
LITPAFCQRRRTGRRDATVDLVWPARECAAYCSSLMGDQGLLKIALTTGPGRAATGPASGSRSSTPSAPVLGEDPTQPFHPHDDRIVSLALHHTTGTSIAHDVIIDAWWARL